MTNTFINHITNTQALTLKDYTRDGYKTVFLTHDTPELPKTLIDLATEHGYNYLGQAINRDTNQTVHVFSKTPTPSLEPLYELTNN